jgi:uncharacterized SAM-binding protein YcdF (DUF218 family)
VTASALVVLGSNSTRTCGRLVAAAERTARRLRPDVVVFSGWSGDDGVTEAEQMRALWLGPSHVEVVLEDTASTTAQNAARTLPLLLERSVTQAVVICAPMHLPRARWIFRNIYERHGVAVRFGVARVAPTPGAFLWELGALSVASRQVRDAQAEVERA